MNLDNVDNLAQSYSCVGYGSSIDNFLTLVTFAYKIQLDTL